MMLTTINRYRSRRAALDGAGFGAAAAGRPDPKARLLLALSMLFWLLGDKAKARFSHHIFFSVHIGRNEWQNLL